MWTKTSATLPTDTTFMGIALNILVKRSVITIIYLLPRSVRINSPSTSIATDFSGAVAGNSFMDQTFRRKLMQILAHLVQLRRITQ